MQVLERFGIEIGKDKMQEGAIYGLASAYLLIERNISDYLRAFNLTPAKFNALMSLKHKGKSKGLSQIEIGRCLIVTASNMTRLLDKLAKEGFIERTLREGDRRVNLIKITPKGSEVLDKAWPGYYSRIREMANLLGKDLKQAYDLLLKWYVKLEKAKA